MARPMKKEGLKSLPRKHCIPKPKLLVEFLKIIGVSEENADQDACKLEHDVSPETINCLLEFIEFVHLLPDNSKWAENFQKYLKKKDML